jgi:phosphomannomutase
MPHSQGSLTVNLSASDADGDPLTYSAAVLSPDPLAQQAYNWSQQYRARYISNIDNLHGAQEKWLLAANGQLFALMPNGDLRQWAGTIAASPVVARFSAAYYADPYLLVDALPPVSMVKLAVPKAPDQVFAALQAFREAVGEPAAATVDLSDGVRVAWPDGWVHVRASNTEALVRVIAEADEIGRARTLAEWARDRLGR